MVQLVDGAKAHSQNASKKPPLIVTNCKKQQKCFGTFPQSGSLDGFSRLSPLAFSPASRKASKDSLRSVPWFPKDWQRSEARG